MLSRRHTAVNEKSIPVAVVDRMLFEIATETHRSSRLKTTVSRCFGDAWIIQLNVPGESRYVVIDGKGSLLGLAGDEQDEDEDAVGHVPSYAECARQIAGIDTAERGDESIDLERVCRDFPDPRGECVDL